MRANRFIERWAIGIAIVFATIVLMFSPASAKNKPEHWRDAISQVRSGNNAALRSAIAQFGLPENEIAREIVMNARNKKVHVNKHRFIEGHEEMPVEVIIDDDAENPTLRVRYELIWEIFTAPNGEVAERCVGNIPYVESLIQ